MQMATTTTILPILLFLFSFSSTPSSSKHLEFTYKGFHHPNTNISLNGVAVIRETGILQLTNETRRLLGHAFYPSPIQFINPATNTAFSFSTSFVFAIHSEYSCLGDGHGFAFAVSPSKELQSAQPNSTTVGNSSNHLFAVEFLDVNDNHIGIDSNTLRSNASAPAAYFVGGVNLKSGKAITAWIDYDSATNLVNITISPSSTKPQTPLLSYQMDLSPILLENMYVGFSASTGLLASAHYISGWSFKIGGQSQPLDLGSLPSIPGLKKKHTSFIISLSVAGFVFVLASILIAVFVIRKIINVFRTIPSKVFEKWSPRSLASVGFFIGILFNYWDGVGEEKIFCSFIILCIMALR